MKCLFCSQVIVKKRKTKKYCDTRCRVSAWRRRETEKEERSFQKLMYKGVEVDNLCEHGNPIGLCKHGCKR